VLTPEAMVANYYKAPQAPAVRGDLQTSPSLWEQALLAYNDKQYTSAAQLFEKVLKRPEFDQRDAAYYYLGNIYLAEKQFPSALKYLKQVSHRSLLYPDAQWYIALAYLGNHQQEEAVLLLNQIGADEVHHQQENAKQLLERLRR
jgi:TolA-binding protein